MPWLSWHCSLCEIGWNSGLSEVVVVRTVINAQSSLSVAGAVSLLASESVKYERMLDASGRSSRRTSNAFLLRSGS